MTDSPLTLHDAIIINCVALLLAPDIQADDKWGPIVLRELHDALPHGNTIHPHVGPLIREALRAWPHATGSVIPRDPWKVRRVWVLCTKWRLGEALDRARSPKAAA
ncbi:MAG: hypothetical protein AAFY65_01255 [Pseudomonadota bacterium]